MPNRYSGAAARTREQNPSFADRRFGDRGSRLDQSGKCHDRWHGIRHTSRDRRYQRAGLRSPMSAVTDPPRVLVAAGWLLSAVAVCRYRW